MDLLKLKKTTILTTAALLALGATEACADNVAVLGHISASVQGSLAIAETEAMNFGNFSVTCGANCTRNATVILSDQGTRTAGTTNAGVDAFTLFNGGTAKVGNHETGAQHPGFFAISGAPGGGAAVYVSFSDNAGNIIDSSYDPNVHPGNYVTLDGVGGATAAAFTVDSFTFETDAGAGAEGTGGYTQAAGHVTDIYGSSVLLTGATATLRVGATLHTAVSVQPVAGQYTGTYYVMVAY